MRVLNLGKWCCSIALGSLTLALLACTGTPSTADKRIHLRIDCGSQQSYKDANGNVWAADTGFEGGNFADPGIPFQAVKSTDTPDIYQTERWSKEPIDYKFQLPNGKYKVVLKMAEVWFQKPGERIFSVDINGKRELDKFDTVAQASGHHVAIDKEFIADVQDGSLKIRVTPNLAEAKINAIEVVQI